MQDTLVLIKPDAVRRRMVGQIVSAIENLGLDIKHLNQKHLTEEEASSLYQEHAGKWHFSRNIRHITSGPSVIVHVCGDNAVSKCRHMVETFRSAHFNYIKLPENLVHATSDAENTERELEAVSGHVVC